MAPEREERRLAAILAADMVGYSRLMEADETGTLAALKTHRRELLDPKIADYRGRIVKTTGDGMIVEFGSVVDAVQCGVDIQRAMRRRNADVPDDRRIEFRVGINLGDIIVDGDDIYGDGVNIASRLESIAEPGGIVLSKQVHDHVGREVQAKFVSLGAKTVKNIGGPIQVYRVELADKAASPNVIRFGSYELDTARFELREAGERVAVEPRVFDLIVFFAKNSERTVTKEEIFAEIWNDRIVSDAALSSQIKAARKVLGDDGASQHTIPTIHGRGFRFVAPIDAAREDSSSERDQEFESHALSEIAKKPSVSVLPLVHRLIRRVHKELKSANVFKLLKSVRVNHSSVSVH